MFLKNEELSGDGGAISFRLSGPRRDERRRGHGRARGRAVGGSDCYQFFGGNTCCRGSFRWIHVNPFLFVGKFFDGRSLEFVKENIAKVTNHKPKRQTKSSRRIEATMPGPNHKGRPGFGVVKSANDWITNTKIGVYLTMISFPFSSI